MAPGKNRKYNRVQVIPAMTESCFQLKLYCNTGVSP